jgi:hypothetical protein
MKYGKKHLKTCKMRTHTVRPGIWRETVKNVKYEKHTLYELDCGEKTDKHVK